MAGSRCDDADPGNEQADEREYIERGVRRRRQRTFRRWTCRRPESDRHGSCGMRPGRLSAPTRPCLTRGAGGLAGPERRQGHATSHQAPPRGTLHCWQWRATCGTAMPAAPTPKSTSIPKHGSSTAIPSIRIPSPEYGVATSGKPYRAGSYRLTWRERQARVMLTEYASRNPPPSQDGAAVSLSVNQQLENPACSPALATARGYTAFSPSFHG